MEWLAPDKLDGSNQYILYTNNIPHTISITRSNFFKILMINTEQITCEDNVWDVVYKF